MAEQILQNVYFYMGGYQMSQYMNQVEIKASNEILDGTRFLDSYMTRVMGMGDVEFSGGGFWDPTQDGILEGNISTENIPVTVCPETADAGDSAYIFKCLQSEYQPIGGSIGELMPFSFAGFGQGEKLVKGNVLYNGTAAATATSTGQTLGAVSSTQKLYAALHVITASESDTLDVIIQSDTVGFPSPTSRITFTQATGVTAEYATPVAGAITDTYWRISYTIAGTDPSFSFIVSMAIA